MFLFYRILINLILLLSPIIVLIRLLQKKEDPLRFKEKLGFFSIEKKPSFSLNLNGSSFFCNNLIRTIMGDKSKIKFISIL